MSTYLSCPFTIQYNDDCVMSGFDEGEVAEKEECTKDEIACQYSRRTYAQTSLVTCFIHAGHLTKQTRDPSMTHCYIQAYGHIFVDQKWAKLTNKVQDVYLEKTPGLHLFDENIKVPLLDPSKQTSSSSGIQTSCLLVTQQETVQPEKLLEDGVFVQLELPTNLLPSFRGLTANIIYNVSVVFVRKDLANPKIFAFPFTVCSKGCAIRPFELKFSHLGVYTPATLTPSDRIQSVRALSNELLRDDDPETYLITPKNCVSNNTIMYGEECIGVLRYSERVYVETFVTIHFDLDNTTKFFDVMRIRFVQTEHREDGTRVQEKEMHTGVRHCRNALRLNMKLALPHHNCTSFVGPTLEVRYHLDVEFHEMVTEENPHSEPVSWNFPVQVLQNPPYKSGKAEMLACIQSSCCMAHQNIDDNGEINRG